ncbi:hypothetical protein A5630_24295 [Mycolicibacterium mucogenicum]|uniref:TM2 domain-containing protein n=1 Tax=Mycolicibacterium mucogenicum TaxID=56689 RepID=A0A1A3GXE9_MYCMU|nr:TM2 domain-containing protein [Mycolicibacterium mucogenicum]OBJ40717.1 hypothetical protein A5630_24295 [Mycolicibacterium mucogenicum]
MTNPYEPTSHAYEPGDSSSQQQPGEPQFGQPEYPGYPQQPGFQQPGYPPPGYPQQPGYPPPGYPQQPGYGYVPQYAADPSAPWGRDPLTGLPLSDKSKVTAGLLQILLGGFGVGRFYLGYTTIGVLQLVVSLVTCGIGAIWPLIDGIMILMGNVPDTQGRKLRD